MKQEELESRVKEIFEQQGFEVSDSGENLVAESEKERKELQVFSSEEHSIEDVKDRLSAGKLVFVDGDLREVEEEVENRVSVLEDRDEEEIETPSYELIGDIAVINELDELSEEDAVEAIRQYHPQVKTVLLKEEPLSGEFRVGEYKRLHGDETETVHKEFGCRFKVDPTEVYYSERFSTERDRVVSQIEKGENVLVMFAGVGPYAVMAARNAEPETVVAVEKNPEAVGYMRENVELNNVQGTVEVHEGDVREVVPELDGSFDRVVMPLPGSADEYLDLARDKLKEDGIIHLYRFENSLGITVPGLEVLSIEDCGDRSPSEKRICYDLRSTNK